MSFLLTSLFIVLVALLLAALYYYFLLLASIIVIRSPGEREEEDRSVKFAVVIPAYNEAAIIGQTLTKMHMLDYDRDLFDVIVIADNCDDDTVEESEKRGAICYEREDRNTIGKGFALGWYFQHILPGDLSYDAVIVFDADSQPAHNFLRIMSNNIKYGYSALQGQHIISNPDENVYTHLADIGMRMTNRLRNLARSNLGLSCRLMGDAMCIDRKILETNQWNSTSLVEDREFGIQLIKNGVHLHYVPEALSHGEAPSGFQEAQSQRMRWSGGVIKLRRQHALSLLSNGIREKDFSSLDWSFELLLPPYSVLVIISMTLPVLYLSFPSLRSASSLWLLVGNALAWLLMPLFGLLLDRAPARLFPYLLLGPFYTVWRSSIILLALLRLNRIPWIRTKRASEKDSSFS